jgi:hypothetical protein
MTSVNVVTQQTKVEVTEGGTTVSVPSSVVATVEAVTAGPQGAKGDAGSGFPLEASAKVNKSVIYYDSAAETFKADATWTTSTLTFGGNF